MVCHEYQRFMACLNSRVSFNNFTLDANRILTIFLNFWGQKYASLQALCHNPSLGFVTKARGCKVASQEGSSGVQESEGIDPHTPKGTPALGVRVMVDSQMFKERVQWSKPNGLKSFLYHWKAIET